MDERTLRIITKLGLSEDDFKPQDKEEANAEALADIWEAICNIELFGLESEE